MPDIAKLMLMLVCRVAQQLDLPQGRSGCCATLHPDAEKFLKNFSMFANGKNAHVRREPERANLRRVSISTASAVHGRAAQGCVFLVVALKRFSIGMAVEKARRARASQRCVLVASVKILAHAGACAPVCAASAALKLFEATT